MATTWVNFKHVREHARFEPVLEHYRLEPKHQGIELVILCPFHQETRPSCKLNPDKRVFHCFGCDERGNVLDFVAKMEKSDLRIAALKLCEICKIEPAPESEQRARPAKPTGDREAAASAATTADKACTEVPPAVAGEIVNPPLTFALRLNPDHPYLAARGLSHDQIELYGLGYCGKGMMRGRVCVPIHNERGELVAYSGRWADETPIPDGEDRYKLPPKFEKSRVLYNLHRIVGEHVVIVEGFWSVFRLHALKVPVVSAMGWSISDAQMELLRDRGVRFITLLLDGDDTGRKATAKLLPQLARSFFVHAGELPEGEKPDTVFEETLLAIVRGQ